VEPVRLEPQLLTVYESPEGHPCAAVDHYRSDLALLSYLLQDLRALARRAAKGEIELAPYQRVTWEVHGLRRRTVICDPPQLLSGEDVLMVGFLGNRRNTPEAAEVEATELDVIDEFTKYPGIVSYSSIELVDHQWANLVIHTGPDDREAWRHSEIHIEAAERLAPKVYHDVRIHNGRVLSGVTGPETIVINTTKYWDYDSPDRWHAQRDFPGGATETIGSPWTDLAE
jgi:hypothetical protein